MRDGEPDVWGALYDRFNPDPDGSGYSRRPSESPLPPEAKARLLDAALGIVGSVRAFLEVTEDVLLDQRSRFRHVPPSEARAADPAAPPSREPEPSVVQDIPMEHR